MEIVRLGSEYRGKTITGATNSPSDVIRGVISFADNLKVDNPTLYKYVMSLTGTGQESDIGGDYIDWDNENNVEVILQKLLSLMDKVAPEGTEFRQNDRNEWAFDGNGSPHDEMNDPAKGASDRNMSTPSFQNGNIRPLGSSLEEKDITHIYNEAIKRVIKESNDRKERA